MAGSDNLMFDYLLEMGAMQPEQQDIKRKQEIVNMLRQGGMQTPQGQMIGKHYVAPNLMQYASQLGTAALAGVDQNALNKQISNPKYNPNMPDSPDNMPGINQRQRKMLQELRRRQGMTYTPPSTESLAGDNIDAGGGYLPY